MGFYDRLVVVAGLCVNLEYEMNFIYSIFSRRRGKPVCLP